MSEFRFEGKWAKWPDVAPDGKRSTQTIGYLVSRMPGVDGVLRDYAEEAGSAARAHLAAHMREGDASIEVKRFDLDWHVMLHDPENGARAIELGTTNADPVAPLAFGLMAIGGRARRRKRKRKRKSRKGSN